MNSLTRVHKLGQGTYGTVYSAINVGSDDETLVAVKRNLMDIGASWIGNIRELDMLARLKGHPFVVDLINVAFGNPFEGNPMTPIAPSDRRVKEDKIHFVMEYVKTDGATYFPDKTRCTATNAKTIVCQLLLAMEFIHSHNVTHRDLKPANILVAEDENGRPTIKVCDFGLSQILCRGCPSTPGVATSWYRAPEICCSVPTYGKESDMWSIGCIIFEIFGTAPLLYAVRDTDEDVFNAILGKLPKSPDREVIRRFGDEGVRIRPQPEATPIRRQCFLEQMNMTREYFDRINQTPGNTDQYIDMLTGLLEIDPDKRLTATQALNHPCFACSAEYIAESRRLYPPVHPALHSITIVACAERKWCINLAFTIYNHRSRIEWYTHRLIFHAIDLFDRYLEWAILTPGNSTLGVLETAHTGRLHSRSESELRFYVCMYVLHKYYASMSYPVDWKTFSPTVYSTPEAELLAEQFERLLIKEVTGYQMYRDTLLEMPAQYSHGSTEKSTSDMLFAYGTCESWNNGSARALYRNIMRMEDPVRQPSVAPVPVPA